MPAQSPWSTNIRSCTTTWLTLYRLTQLKQTFADAGAVHMHDMKFYNPTLSQAALRQEANMLADMIDIIFTVGRGAGYEKDSNREKALEDMVRVLTDAEKTVADFAAVNDSNYLFWNEKNEA